MASWLPSLVPPSSFLGAMKLLDVEDECEQRGLSSKRELRGSVPPCDRGRVVLWRDHIRRDLSTLDVATTAGGEVLDRLRLNRLARGHYHDIAYALSAAKVLHECGHEVGLASAGRSGS